MFFNVGFKGAFHSLVRLTTVGAESTVYPFFPKIVNLKKKLFKKVKYLAKHVLFLAIEVHEGLILPKGFSFQV